MMVRSKLSRLLDFPDFTDVPEVIGKLGPNCLQAHNSVFRMEMIPHFCDLPEATG
ncbi:hypothetical protein SBDP1_470004 [Syntrophobacter sp. SbD1]|nr:hypothetical protein SBDP1_470004 [Syntrophobacter sp. SbD1]